MELVCQRFNEQFAPDDSQGGIIPDLITATCIDYNSAYPDTPQINANTWSLGSYGIPTMTGSPCVPLEGCPVRLLDIRGLEIAYNSGDESRPKIYPLGSEIRVTCPGENKFFGPDRSGKYENLARTALTMKCIDSHGYPWWDALVDKYQVTAVCSVNSSKSILW